MAGGPCLSSTPACGTESFAHRPLPLIRTLWLLWACLDNTGVFAAQGHLLCNLNSLLPCKQVHKLRRGGIIRGHSANHRGIVIFFRCGCPVDPAPLTVKTVLCSRIIFCRLCRLGWGGKPRRQDGALQPPGLGVLDGAATEIRSGLGSRERRLRHRPGLGGRTLEPIPFCLDCWVISAGSPSPRASASVSSPGASCPALLFFIWAVESPCAVHLLCDLGRICSGTQFLIL